MKILFVLTYYTPHWTGLTEHAKRFAEALAKKKHTVRVVCVQHEKQLKLHENIQGVDVYRTPYQFRLSRTLISLSYFYQVYKQIRLIDVVVCYTPCFEVLLVVIASLILKKRIVLVHNGDLILPRGIMNSFIMYCNDLISFLSGIFADRLIAYSDDYARHSRFLRHFLHKTTSIFPLFDKSKALKKSIKINTNGFKQKNPVIGFAGRFVEEKGFDLLLQAIPFVLERYPKATFLFAGETHIIYEHFFEKNIKLIENIGSSFKSVGLLPQNKMYEFFDLLDLFVLPSRSDCLALVQVEAMLSGVPVLATDIPGARVVVKTTGYGILVPANSVSALADGITKSLEHIAEFRQAKNNIYTLVDEDRSLNQFESVLKGTI